MLPYKITVICPYCGTKNEVPITTIKKDWPVPTVVLCEVEEAGCDRYFLIQAEAKVTHTVKALADPGEHYYER